jgi:DNA-3-methyladenine glycosylase II
MHEITSTLLVTPPFRLDLTVCVLRRRQKNSIDQWDGQSYSRILVLDDLPVKLVVSQSDVAGSSQVIARLQSSQQLSSEQQFEARATVRKLLGLKIELRPFYLHVATDKTLEQLADQFRGVRPPRFPTVFEALVNAIACQQLSLDVGILLLNRLTENFGVVYTDGNDSERAFPRPEDLLNIPEEEFKKLGFSYNKARAIKELAYSVMNEDIQLEQLDGVANEIVLQRLQAIRGIGRWSAEYALLRGLGRLDVFPGDDIGGQNNVRTLLQLETRPSYEQLKVLTDSWQPYAGFVYFHLLLSKLRAKGLV